MTSGSNLYPTTGVWWDFNTCPVTNDFEPGRVRPSIESALKKLYGPGPVQIFALGNLEFASRRTLEEINSSGINARNASFDGASELSNDLVDWIVFNNLRPTKIMIISGNRFWYDGPFLRSFNKGDIIVAFPIGLPLIDNEGYTIRVWESLLKDYSGPPVKANSQSSWFCSLCKIPSHNIHDFIQHLKSTEHEDYYASLDSQPNNFTKPCEEEEEAIQGFDEKLCFLPKGGVWWDLDTCPVPDHVDVRYVRPCIESALQKRYYGCFPVTIFAMGNLEKFPPRILEEISSYGILLRHAPYSGVAELFDVLFEWRERNPVASKIMLISGDMSWCSPDFLRFGYSILRAFPDRLPAKTHYSDRAWVWESFLEEYSDPLVETNNQILEEKCIETGEPAWFCRPCKIPSQSCDDFIKHLKSTEHKQNEASLVAQSKSLTILWEEAIEGFEKKLCIGPKTMGVWWDLNTCWVPKGYDIGCVRPCIESALHKLFGPRPVTIFAVGNLEFFPSRILEAISSSGILLRHTHGGGIELYNVLCEWGERNPSPAKIMLISGDKSWCDLTFLSFGYTILRASPTNSWPVGYYGSYKEWIWESLLKDYSGPPVKTSNQILETGEPACFCRVCELPSQSSHDFDKHLKSTDHALNSKEDAPEFVVRQLWDSVPLDKNKFTSNLFCEFCKYPAYNRDIMIVHLNSKEHAMTLQLHSELHAINVLKQERASGVPQNLVAGPSEFHEREASLVYQPSTTQEGDPVSKKRTQEEDLLNEVNKKRTQDDRLNKTITQEEVG